MTAVTPTTKLDAVNRILSAVGQRPVTSLSGTLEAFAASAVATLDETDLAAQSVGWMFNVERVQIAPVASRVSPPANCVRFVVDPTEAGTKRYTLRDDGGSLHLYNLTDNTFVITATMHYTCTLLQDFVNCPESYKRYVTIRAARVCAQRVQADQVRVAYGAADEREAFWRLKQEEGIVNNRTIFDGYDAARPLLRNSVGIVSPANPPAAS